MTFIMRTASCMSVKVASSSLSIWNLIYKDELLKCPVSCSHNRGFFFLAQDASGAVVGEEQGQSNVNVMCRICFFGENEASERARRMLSCKSCGKKYHRSCLKSWAQHRGKASWSLESFEIRIFLNVYYGLYPQIYFIGVHGLALPAEHAR